MISKPRTSAANMVSMQMNSRNVLQTQITSRLLFRLLPVQILLAVIGSVNGIVSSLFASNYVGVEAMSAVGLYHPVNMLLNALSTMLVGGSAILYGKYMGRNDEKKTRNVFSLSITLAFLLAAAFIIVNGNEDVASMTPAHVITANGPGTAEIYIFPEESSHSQKITVTVTDK